MTIYGPNEVLNMRPETYKHLLVGSLVEVTYSVKHYHMGANSQCTKASDTFSAQITSISVLRPPPPVLHNPIQAMVLPRKPPCLPQTLSHGAQVSAVHSFISFPQGVKQPNFTLSNGAVLPGITLPVTGGAVVAWFSGGGTFHTSACVHCHVGSQ